MEMFIFFNKKKLTPDSAKWRCHTAESGVRKKLMARIIKI
jgi:hypothetical protein